MERISLNINNYYWLKANYQIFYVCFHWSKGTSLIRLVSVSSVSLCEQSAILVPACICGRALLALGYRQRSVLTDECTAGSS